VIGALIGRQEGRNIEVMNSFELLAHSSGGHVLIDKEYCYTKEEQFKQVFKDLEFLGWYTTGGPPEPADIHVHKQFWGVPVPPRPVLAIFGVSLASFGVSPLPPRPVVAGCGRFGADWGRLAPGQATMLFAELPYTLATEEAERIGVDHVARMTATGGGENSTVLGSLIVPGCSLKPKFGFLAPILGEVPFNHEILREACALCHCLPVLSTDKFKTDFYD
ncbi:CSN6 protein, partial [Rhabdornis inornatus]|nr:CSN6 protein [Rhabdornis inornatus]